MSIPIFVAQPKRLASSPNSQLEFLSSRVVPFAHPVVNSRADFAGSSRDLHIKKEISQCSLRKRTLSTYINNATLIGVTGLLYANVYMHVPTVKLDFKKKKRAPSNAQTVQTLIYIGSVSSVGLFENLMFQIRLKPTPMSWKYPSVGQIRSQIFW